ncbi:hypothetical protein [Micromonospora arida]|uniref:hypothetical protein n=1 Tax=Micromonospora arida TaxID=2203715 RepID=UPI0033B5ACEC
MKTVDRSNADKGNDHKQLRAEVRRRGITLRIARKKVESSQRAANRVELAAYQLTARETDQRAAKTGSRDRVRAAVLAIQAGLAP